MLLGALIVGAFVATTEEARISGNVGMGTRALNAAEFAAESDLSGWAAAMLDSVAIARQTSHSTAVNGLAVTTTLIRLDSSVYWIVAEATDAGSGPGLAPLVRRRIGLLARRVSDSTGKATLFRLGERPWSELF